ncbi:STAS/SEC14 domain-containing protein [uncultured Draconibacterium sp.]|uniref:STAS/SEC14 domain-containing protein n=1 Tax=uncultured Draconibacterium sp. TaxID=1573823 RepID=UPI0029C8346B|nr:STAS/SEC14 domain-containing protein [uncultured Draconibacterium sp.]
MQNLNITYNSDNHIVYITKEGKISLNEAILVLNKLVEEYGKLETIYILEDSRQSRLDISLLEVREFFREIRKNVTGRKEIRHADMVDTPFETAMGVIFQQMVAPLKGYDYRCFSTEEAALAWLKKGTYYPAK